MPSTQLSPGPESRLSRAERTRSLILEAAGLRFAASGYAATRLEDVGQDVGIGRSAVLYHFKDKRLLYRAVLDDLFGELLEIQRAALMTKGSLADRLEDAICRFVDFMGQNPTAARLAMRELIHLDSEIRSEFHSSVKPYLELLAMIFAEGKRSGEFRSVRSDPYHFLSTITGSTLFYVAALPSLVAELPYDRLSTEQLDAHKRDLLEITRRLLGIRGPRLQTARKAIPTGEQNDDH
jgi:AcrR family transcriptional regulator